MASFKEGQYPNGRVELIDNSYVYIPNNVTSDTPVSVFYTGDIGYAKTSAAGNLIGDIIKTDGFDQIVILNNHGSDYIYSQQYLDNRTAIQSNIISTIESKYNVTLDKVNTLGSSSGDKCALYNFAQLCKDGKDNGFCVITGASTINYNQTEGQKYSTGPNRAFLQNEDYAAIEGKTVFIFEGKAGENYSYVQQLRDHGVDVVLVECKNSGHDPLTANPLKDNIFEFMDGDVTKFLENDNYKFTRCTDSSLNNWEELSDDEVEEIVTGSKDPVKLYERVISKNGDLNSFASKYRGESGTLASSLCFVSNSMQNISSKLEQHNLSGSEASGIVGSFAGTNSYFCSISDSVTSSIATEIKAISEIANNIFKMDEFSAHLADTSLTSAGFATGSGAGSVQVLSDSLAKGIESLTSDDIIGKLVTNIKPNGKIGMTNISDLENVMKSANNELKNDIASAIEIKGLITDFSGNIGEGNILAGGIWDEVNKNLKTYDALMELRKNSGEFLLDTMKVATNLVRESILNGYKDIDQHITGSIISIQADSVDDSRLDELVITLRGVKQTILILKQKVDKMRSSQHSVSDIDPITKLVVGTHLDPSEEEIASVQSQVDKNEELYNELMKIKVRIEGYIEACNKAQKMIDNAVEIVNTSYKNAAVAIKNNEPIALGQFNLDFNNFGLSDEQVQGLREGFDNRMNEIKQEEESRLDREEDNEEDTESDEDNREYGNGNYTGGSGFSGGESSTGDGGSSKPSTPKPTTTTTSPITQTPPVKEEEKTKIDDVIPEEQGHSSTSFVGGRLQQSGNYDPSKIGSEIEGTLIANNQIIDENVLDENIPVIITDNNIPNETNASVGSLEPITNNLSQKASNNGKLIGAISGTAGLGLATGIGAYAGNKVLKEKEEDEEELDYDFETV